MPPLSISLFFPAYNDAQTIGDMVAGAVSVARCVTDDFEIIVVDDASTDGTPDVLQELCRANSQLRVIRHDTNAGYGAALQAGFAAATKELIFYTDGDAQYDVRELPKLLQALREDVEWVNGYKTIRCDPWYRVVAGDIYRRAVRRLFDLSVRDPDCDFRLIRRRALERFHLQSKSGAICVELVRRLQDEGFRGVQVPVHHYPRVYGRSQFFKLPHVTRTLFDVMRLWLTLVVRRKLTSLEPVVERGREPRMLGKTPIDERAFERSIAKQTN